MSQDELVLLTCALFLLLPFFAMLGMVLWDIVYYWNTGTGSIYLDDELPRLGG